MGMERQGRCFCNYIFYINSHHHYEITILLVSLYILSNFLSLWDHFAVYPCIPTNFCREAYDITLLSVHQWWPSLTETCKGSILLLKITVALMEFNPNLTHSVFSSIFQSLQCEAYGNQNWSWLNVTTVHHMHFLKIICL
jgi:hypothetical protein